MITCWVRIIFRDYYHKITQETTFCLFSFFSNIFLKSICFPVNQLLQLLVRSQLNCICVYKTSISLKQISFLQRFIFLFIDFKAEFLIKFPNISAANLNFLKFLRCIEIGKNFLNCNINLNLRKRKKSVKNGFHSYVL